MAPSPRDLVVLRPEGLYLPGRRFPHRSVAAGPARGDHARPRRPRARRHGRYHATRAGLPILRWRLGDDSASPRTTTARRSTLGDARVSLHPAGHVLGSAQVRIEVDGADVGRLGRLQARSPIRPARRSRSCRCDVFITEATFALPVYRWPHDAARSRARSSTGGTNARRAARRRCCSATRSARRSACSPNSRALTDRPGAGCTARSPRACRSIATAGVAHAADARRSPTNTRRATSPANSCSRRRPPRARRGCGASAAHRPGSPRAGCACAAIAGGATTTAASSSPTTPTGRDLLRTIRETGARRVLATHGNTDALVRALREEGIARRRCRTRVRRRGLMRALRRPVPRASIAAPRPRDKRAALVDYFRDAPPAGRGVGAVVARGRQDRRRAREDRRHARTARLDRRGAAALPRVAGGGELRTTSATSPRR